MPIFPDMLLPPPGAPLGASNGGEPVLPAGDTSGVLAGLERSLLAILRNYRPGDIGICEVGEKLQLSLPVPDWAMWGSLVTGVTAEADAGASTYLQVFQVPTDERWYLEYVLVSRASGDNRSFQLRITCPSGYVDGPVDNYRLHALVTGISGYNWPDEHETLPIDITVQRPPGGLLLEPGTILDMNTNGTGVAATTFNTTCLTRRTKIIRAMVP